HITKYLNSTTTRTLLGVDPSASTPYSMCSGPVLRAFGLSHDQQVSTTLLHVAALLERGRWTRDLEWRGQGAFAERPLRAWEVDGVRAGVTRREGGLRFATVEGAGHMVPYDKPKEA
ncbi:hypothetical protein H0H92_011737, partial [Tricholoma furcatifolium]